MFLRRVLFFLLFLSALPGFSAKAEKKEDARRPIPQPEDPAFLTEIPEYPGNGILCRPTDRSVTLSLLWHENKKIQVLYAPEGENWTHKTPVLSLLAHEPQEILLSDLAPASRWHYRVIDATSDLPLFPENHDGFFQTARAPSKSFSFAIQADSHLDEQTVLPLYHSALSRALAARPDFLIDLGDTFMTGKHPDRESAALQYAAQRYHLGRIGHSVPLFLALGNHDGEENKRGTTGPDGLATWSCFQRKRFFPNPEPDPFYSGNDEKHPHAGTLQNYYAWQWGDALFVVLDPYWTSLHSKGKNPWQMSLGKTQYDWLAKTLRSSTAKHKLVFIHQLVGGFDKSGRGGTEASFLYEWGGHEPNGEKTFQKNRPGWEQPIHDLLKETGVGWVFHGHDHFYAKQERDGILYQLVPQPAHRNNKKHPAAEYGYQTGDFQPNSGILLVTVSPEKVRVEFLRSSAKRTKSLSGNKASLLPCY